MNAPTQLRLSNWIRVELEAGSLSIKEALRYVEGEPNFQLARQASHDLVRYSPCDALDEFHIVLLLIERYRQNRLANAGAVLAGLLDLGERRINAVLRSSRKTMTRKEMHEFTRIHGSEIQASTVEFYLEWLLELTPGRDRERLRLVASSLMLMLLNDTTGWVVDQHDTVQVGARGAFSPVRRRFEDYLPTVEKVLSKILEKRDEPEIVQALSAWRLHVEKARTLRLEIEAVSLSPATATSTRLPLSHQPRKKEILLSVWA